MTNKLFFLLIGLILFAGCNNAANHAVTVTITEVEWSHWWETEDEFPDPIITTAQMQRGDTVSLDRWDSTTVTVLNIRVDYVVIRFDGSGAFPAICWPERYEQRVFEITYGDRFVLDNGAISTITFWQVVFEKENTYDQP